VSEGVDEVGSKPLEGRLEGLDADITELINGWAAGDREDADRVLPLIYEELRKIAGRLVWSRGGEGTLGPTAVVHELFLKLDRTAALTFESRRHFFALAVRTMRQALVDHCRGKARIKRGGDRYRVPLESVAERLVSQPEMLVALDEALHDLHRRNPRMAETVELRFYGGLTIEETASCLGIAPKTVIRDWRRARAWLYRALTVGAGPAPED
jgi:RNA polymerase sigma-70 factor (ECF subfamily)